MADQPIRLAWPDVGAEEARAVAEVLESGQLTMGPKVAEFESGLAAATGTGHAVAVSSGTAALHLTVLALGLGPGDEVLVPAYTFPATANAVALAGATPVLVDVDPETLNVDGARLAGALTPRTRAAMAVHLFGRPVGWDAFEALPEGVTVVEDAAGALGAQSRGRPCGSLGVAGCLSFHPRKIVTTGEGGAVVTNDDTIVDGIRRLRHHGIEPQGEFEIRAPATNYRLADILCAVGVPSSAACRSCSHSADGSPAGTRSGSPASSPVPDADEGDEHGWQAYVVRLDRAGTRRSHRFAPRGSRLRSGRTRSIGSGPTATRARSPAPTWRTSARSRCHSTRALTEADVDRVVAALRPFAD